MNKFARFSKTAFSVLLFLSMIYADPMASIGLTYDNQFNATISAGRISDGFDKNWALSLRTQTPIFPDDIRSTEISLPFMLFYRHGCVTTIPYYYGSIREPLFGIQAGIGAMFKPEDRIYRTLITYDFNRKSVITHLSLVWIIDLSGGGKEIHETPLNNALKSIL